jgi:glucose/arabinose dehydrogenase
MLHKLQKLLGCVAISSLFVTLSFAQRGDLELKRENSTARRVLEVGSGNVRLVHNPANGSLYMLHSEKGVLLLDLEKGSEKNVAGLLELNGVPAGMTFDNDGNLYVVTNKNADEHHNIGAVRKGTPKSNGKFEWSTVAQTEPYPLSNTIFNHNYNGIAVSPDGQYLFVNAGSRTDHGEVQDFDGLFSGLREAPLSSKILRIPLDSIDLVLPNDEAKLLEGGYLYAWGVRNAFDLAFAPNGDLFAVENGPDADYPEELNWIREGHHYGFPWKFGDLDNQTRLEQYSSEEDKLQQPDFTAVREGYYQSDPDFPEPPMEFTMPVVNLGPDAAYYRALDGSERNAAELGEKLYTFTPHISPLGLVFANDTLPEDLQNTDETYSAFLVSWGAAGGTLTDKGQTLLHLSLTKTADNYEMVTTEIASGFVNPVDAVLVENKLYVLEWGSEGAIWELTFE